MIKQILLISAIGVILSIIGLFYNLQLSLIIYSLTLATIGFKIFKNNIL